MSSADPREREDLCGRALVPEKLGEELAEAYDPETWYEAEDGTDYCCREVWDDADDGRCIWHADVEGKPAHELAAARSESPERLDSVVLRESDLGDRVSLSDCRLIVANLAGADLADADLGGADLLAADLDEAVLVRVDLSGADLRGADLGGAYLLQADLGGADLQEVDLGGADLGRADLGDAGLQYADLRGADLADADLDGANLHLAHLGGGRLIEADLSGADLRGADIGDANLARADLVGATLRDADFGGATLRDADFGGATLRDADFGGATLRGADLTACSLHHTTFEDATFDESTTFGTSSGYEIEADAAAEDASWLATHVSPRLRALGRPATDPDPLEHAATQYRTVQRLRREHDLKQDPALEIQEKHARRKRALAERRYGDWFKLAFYRWPMGYGEQPGHVVGTSVAVIVASALLYPLVGGVARSPTPAGTTVAAYDVLPAVSITPPAWLAELLTSVYFSVVTFTTLGYGDLRPASGAAEAVATVESFVGALLMALLVYVLGRRATW